MASQPFGELQHAVQAGLPRPGLLPEIDCRGEDGRRPVLLEHAVKAFLLGAQLVTCLVHVLRLLSPCEHADRRGQQSAHRHDTARIRLVLECGQYRHRRAAVRHFELPDDVIGYLFVQVLQAGKLGDGLGVPLLHRAFDHDVAAIPKDVVDRVLRHRLVRHEELGGGIHTTHIMFAH